MDNNLCLEKHKRIDEKLELHDKRLNNHAARIDKLEQNDKVNNEKISNLCKEIASLVTTMRWFIGLIVGAFVSFFFYAVQNNLFK